MHLKSQLTPKTNYSSEFFLHRPDNLSVYGETSELVGPYKRKAHLIIFMPEIHREKCT